MNADVCDRSHKGRELLPYAEAVRLLLRSAGPLAAPAGMVPLAGAAGRVLAAPIALDRAEPPRPRSAMDGFAVSSAEGAAPRAVVGAVYAGTAEVAALAAGEAVAVMTGGTVPPGADAVVPVELTRVESGPDGARTLHLEAAPAPGQHVRAAGEMGSAGRVLLQAGAVLDAACQAAAAGCGADPVAVRAQPRVIVVSTGDEVVAWTQAPGPHQVRDSNRLATALQLGRAGAVVVRTARIPDQPAELRAGLAAALEDADLVVTIGGVSMGEKDHLPGVFDALGVERVFHGVSVQPGKPVWFGMRGPACVLGLPGNPVSSFVCAELFGVPLVQRLGGRPVDGPRLLEAGIAGGAARSRGRERFLPAALEVLPAGLVQVTPRHETGSGDWTSLAGATALLHLPERSACAAGEAVRFLRLT